MNREDREVARLYESGRVVYNDPPSPGGEDEPENAVGAESPGFNGIDTNVKRRSNDIETALKPCSNDIETASKPSPTQMALFSQWLLTVNKDKLREEYNDKQKFCKELADGKLIKSLTSGVYTLETLPMNKQKELCDYAEKKYGFDWNKVKDLVMITRIFTRVPKKIVVLMNMAWIFALGITVYTMLPEPSHKPKAAAASKTALTGEARKADSLYIKNWADSKHIYLYDCRVANLLTPAFHSAGDHDRRLMMEAEYKAQQEAVSKKKK